MFSRTLAILVFSILALCGSAMAQDKKEPCNTADPAFNIFNVSITSKCNPGCKYSGCNTDDVKRLIFKGDVNSALEIIKNTTMDPMYVVQSLYEGGQACYLTNLIARYPVTKENYATMTEEQKTTQVRAIKEIITGRYTGPNIELIMSSEDNNKWAGTVRAKVAKDGTPSVKNSVSVHSSINKTCQDIKEEKAKGNTHAKMTPIQFAVKYSNPLFIQAIRELYETNAEVPFMVKTGTTYYGAKMGNNDIRPLRSGFFYYVFNRDQGVHGFTNKTWVAQYNEKGKKTGAKLENQGLLIMPVSSYSPIVEPFGKVADSGIGSETALNETKTNVGLNATDGGYRIVEKPNLEQKEALKDKRVKDAFSELTKIDEMIAKDACKNVNHEVTFANSDNSGDFYNTTTDARLTRRDYYGNDETCTKPWMPLTPQGTDKMLNPPALLSDKV